MSTPATGHETVVVHADHDAGGVDIIHHAAAVAVYGAGSTAANALDDYSHRRFRTQHGHSLARHVGANRCAVGVDRAQEGTSDAATDTMRATRPCWIYGRRSASSPALFARRPQFIHQPMAFCIPGPALAWAAVLAFFQWPRVKVDVAGHCHCRRRAAAQRSGKPVLVQAMPGTEPAS